MRPLSSLALGCEILELRPMQLARVLEQLESLIQPQPTHRYVPLVLLLHPKFRFTHRLDAIIPSVPSNNCNSPSDLVLFYTEYKALNIQ